MSKLAKRLIGESAVDKAESSYKPPKEETRTYTVTCRPEFLDQIEHMFSWMNSTASGHSGSMELSIDGDGAPRVHIEKKGGELAKPEEEFKPGSGPGPEFRVSLESLNTPKMIIETFKPQKIWVCPHCIQEIHEKHTFYRNEQEYHSDCKGALKRPPYDWSGVSPEWRALIEPKK
jgi:hypothetical protein